MSKIVVTMFVSLDGVTEAPEKWSMKFWNDQIAKFKYEETFSCEAMLLGRVTYDGFAASWPSRKDPFSDRFNGMPKYVASTTLKTLDWNNSTLLGPDVPAAVAAVKQKATGDLVVHGSMTLVKTLMQHDLVDEYRLLVYPVVLGAGKRLFLDDSRATLKLAEATPYGPDVVLLRYEPRR